MKTELEKRASKFIDETDTMQFTTMELLTMFAEKEQALQLLQTDVSSLLKAERETTKEEIREWLRGEDFEGLAERL